MSVNNKHWRALFFRMYDVTKNEDETISSSIKMAAEIKKQEDVHDWRFLTIKRNQKAMGQINVEFICNLEKIFWRVFRGHFMSWVSQYCNIEGLPVDEIKCENMKFVKYYGIMFLLQAAVEVNYDPFIWPIINSFRSFSYGKVPICPLSFIRGVTRMLGQYTSSSICRWLWQ